MLTKKLDEIMAYTRAKGAGRKVSHTNQHVDLLMEALGVTPAQKRANAQFWGLTLGRCWEKMVIASCEDHADYATRIRRGGNGEYCDLVMGQFAIDTKYRMGSGCVYTANSYVEYGEALQGMGYTPVMLFLREDSLPEAITRLSRSWFIMEGDSSLDFVKDHSGIDLKGYLEKISGKFDIAA